MRIVEFCTDFPSGGGIQRHVLDLTAWLRHRGHTVWLAGEPGAWANAGSDSFFQSLPMYDIAGSGRPVGRRILSALRSAAGFRRFLRIVRPDIIHCHETAPAVVARIASLGLGITLVFTFHGAAPDRVASAARIARACADLVLSPSRICLDALINHGVRDSRAKVVGLGIAAQPQFPPDRVAAIRRRYLPDGKGFLVFSLSRLDPQKGIDIMIAVARLVLERHPEVVFVVAGGGPLRHQVALWADQAGIAGQMRFLGPIDDAPVHLQAADLFLLTSRWEALPISIVEAFRAGLPVIATDCGGVSELVDDSRGALCQVGDVAGIAQRIIHLVEDRAALADKASAASNFANSDRFDPGVVHAGIETLYLALTKPGRPLPAPER